MMMSSKYPPSQFRRWLLRTIFMWAMVYLPSAYAVTLDCSWKDATRTGYQKQNWAVPKLPAGSARLEIPTTAITITIPFKDCPSTEWTYTFGPVMNEFSDSGRGAIYTNISSEVTAGVFKGKYQFSPQFSVEVTASFSNFQGPNCKPSIETVPSGQGPIGFSAGTPGFKITNKPSSPCTGFTYTEKMVVVQTADLVWDSYRDSCSDPYTSNECLITHWVPAQLWSGMHLSFIVGGSMRSFPYIPMDSRLEIWAKFAPIPTPTPQPIPPKPPAPGVSCHVVLKSAVKHKR